MSNRQDRRKAASMARDKDGHRFCIDFKTEEMPGRIVAITVALDKWIMGPDDVANVALVDHPLYPALEQYVRNNPSTPQRNKLN